MSDITVGTAPDRKPERTGLAGKVQPLVDAALTHPGEWVSMETPDGVQNPSLQSLLRGLVAAALADYSVKGGRVYLRIKS